MAQGARGYALIYLTVRPYLLDQLTRAWLADLGDEGDTVALGESYIEHIEAARDAPPAAQPFRR